MALSRKLSSPSSRKKLSIPDIPFRTLARLIRTREHNLLGAYVQFSHITSGSPEPKHNVDIRWNVCEDARRNVFAMHAGSVSGGNVEQGGNHSVVRNIISGIFSTGSHGRAISSPTAFTELYLNTIVDAASPDLSFAFFRFSYEPDVSSMDMMGNLMIDTSSWSASRLDANSKVGYNCYAGTYTVFNKTYGGDVETTKTALAMGDFKYNRRKLDGLEVRTIPDIVPTSSTPSSVRTMVPTSGGNQIGSRSGIGVDDELCRMRLPPPVRSPSLFQQF